MQQQRVAGSSVQASGPARCSQHQRPLHQSGRCDLGMNRFWVQTPKFFRAHNLIYSEVRILDDDEVALEQAVALLSEERPQSHFFVIFLENEKMVQANQGSELP